MSRLLVLVPLLLLTACASAPTRSGFLSTYDGLTPRSDTVRAKVEQRRDEAILADVRRVAIEPTVLVGPGGWLTPGERVLLQRELDA